MNSLFKTITTAIKDDDNVIPMSQTTTSKQMIFVKNLELQMNIGVTDEERAQKQTVMINLKSQVIPASNWQADDILTTVSYADIIEDIKDIAQNKKYRLLETFAENILSKCFSYAQITSVELEIHKPDVISETESVGVHFYREK